MSRLLQRISHVTKQFSPTNTVLSNRLLCSSSDEDKPKKTPGANKTKNKEAIDRLNSLLQQFVADDQQSKQKQEKLNLARPIGRNVQTEPGVQSAKVESVETKIVGAVKNVAESLGGNKVQTESELLNRLMNGDEKKMPTASLSDIVRGMKIDRMAKPDGDGSKAQQVRNVLEAAERNYVPRERNVRQHRPQRQPMIDPANAETVDIFGSEPLGIFSKGQPTEEQKVKSTWDKLFERELRLAVTHPPLNYFQEQILWTEQGKIWKFPIDNEQGMENEQNVYFAEHVFLEEHLEPWCPSKGPVRHFMELVCVGLSKNPYMSVEDKREHIKWFENYFEEKKKLLKETGAIPDEVSSTKQIESD